MERRVCLVCQRLQPTTSKPDLSASRSRPDLLRRRTSAGPIVAVDVPALSRRGTSNVNVEALREWPFDNSTIGRFALYLLIPVGSWIGGALVERVIDVLLS